MIGEHGSVVLPKVIKLDGSPGFLYIDGEAPHDTGSGLRPAVKRPGEDGFVMLGAAKLRPGEKEALLTWERIKVLLGRGESL